MLCRHGFRGEMSKRVVIYVSIGIFVSILGWDLYLALDGVDGNTVTQVLVDISHRYLLMPWFVGFLMGYLTCHFFED